MPNFYYILFVCLFFSGCSRKQSATLHPSHIDQLESSIISDRSSIHSFDWEQAENDPYGTYTVYFDYDDDRVRPHQADNLKRIVDYAYKIIKKGQTVIIEGHAGLHGKKQWYQDHIANRRAQSVSRALIKHGIPKKQIKVFSRGQGMPAHLHPEKTPDQQGSNRRVEVYGIAD